MKKILDIKYLGEKKKQQQKKGSDPKYPQL